MGMAITDLRKGLHALQYRLLTPSTPCDITSTVGPFAFGSNNSAVAATSAGIEATYYSTSNTPVYLSGGTITGSKGQTCNLSSFNGVIGATADRTSHQQEHRRQRHATHDRYPGIWCHPLRRPPRR